MVIRYVPDWYKTEKICGKVILENGGAWKFIYHWYKNQKIYYKTVDNYPID